MDNKGRSSTGGGQIPEVMFLLLTAIETLNREFAPHAAREEVQFLLREARLWLLATEKEVSGEVERK